MGRDEATDRWAPDGLSDDDDDVEIIEVVGLDDDAPPAADDLLPDEAPEPSEPAPVAPSVPAAEPAVGATSAAVAEAVPGFSDRERLLRLRADLDNMRKRMERDREEFRAQASADLVARLLPVIDNLERALAHEAEGGASNGLRRGVELIHRQLLEELAREGLRPVEAVGEPFDPNHHEAVETEATPEHPPNTVLEEFQRGYLFRERLLRPSLVKVSIRAADTTGPDRGGEES